MKNTMKVQEKALENDSFFSSICMDRCGGGCCDPWWGIISYGVVKHGGLTGLEGFRDELARSISARAKRIVDNYVTAEPGPRPLFTAPEKYNVSIRDIKVSGTTITMDLLAMFAFRCLFLSPGKACMIHPAVVGSEIRPPHCGFMGSPGARPNEKGYCRIIHAAGDAAAAVTRALETERSASLAHYRSGAASAEAAADGLIARLRDYCSTNAPALLGRPGGPVPGRNDPCWCGSSLKYKKCHGR